MEYLNPLIALVLPALLGGLCLELLTPAGTPARPMVVWGNGLLVGLIGIPLIMRLLDALGAPLTYQAVGGITGALVVMAGLGLLVRKKSFQREPRPMSVFASRSAIYKLAIIIFVLLIVLRVATLGLELLWRPLYPFDATMHWATKARVWFEYQSLVPFVDNMRWLELAGEGVFTDHHPGYPITTPLLQVWTSLAIGHWDESLINLPWLACLVGIGLAFYGQARVAGATSLTAIVFTYMLLSMPLINIHVALAGYADLFLGACYCAALMAFHNWAISRQSWQAVLAAFFALSCPLIKNEGFYWLLTFAPGLLLVLLPWRKALAWLAGLTVVLLALLVLIPRDFEIAGHSLGWLGLVFRPGAPEAIASSLFVHDNWHLFAYLLPGLLVSALVLARPGVKACIGIGGTLASAIGLFLILFIFTRYASGAIRFTAVGRISVQLVPGMMFLALLLYDALSQKRIPDRECQGDS